MARDVVGRLRERLELTKGSNYAQDLGGYVCLNTDELEGLLAVVEAAKKYRDTITSDDYGEQAEYGNNLDDALARLYADTDEPGK